MTNMTTVKKATIFLMIFLFIDAFCKKCSRALPAAWLKDRQGEILIPTREQGEVIDYTDC